TDKVYTSYHDTEWGVPEWDSRALWEKLILDGFQAGLSWITILRKRDAFRAAFAGFDPERVAAFGEEDIARLLSDPGIVRHRGKIEATIKSANLYLEIEADQGFSTYLWSYVDGAPVQNTYARMEDVPAFTPLSEQISKDLKARGFRFVGPTIVYAAMQAMGLVNDHLTGCFRHTEVAALSPAPATRG
ncbi:MAG: DNA-3-methyladenine glycosylase I, partial [Pseudomonadota bacterium]